MMLLRRLVLVLFLCAGHAGAAELDVLHYSVSIEPDIANKTIKGIVTIKFVTDDAFVEFDCGALVIDSVLFEGKPLKFTVKDHRVRIELPDKSKERRVEIHYHGAPKYGLRFFPDRHQAYTVFSTSQWMVCRDDPADRATLTMTLSTPMGLTHVANGRVGTQNFRPNGMRTTEWNQTTPIPTYIFGFAVGPYKAVTEKKGNVEFRYLATTDFSETEVRRIFRDTPGMLEFFESRAGVKYPGTTYTQVLAAGGVAQEMDAFSALKEAYGKEVLANEQDQWLGAHEFAHQWWGNMVTCRDWNHFWINEGVASFMAAAYLEHRFGRAAYLREIESYRANYEKVKAAGKDKSLVFPDWNNPTREDRTLVYDKGAYVIHLLREEMGERAFWDGLRLFTRRHFGKSVVTSDFTSAMEEAAGKGKRQSLQMFFAKWIYLQNG